MEGVVPKALTRITTDACGYLAETLLCSAQVQRSRAAELSATEVKRREEIFDALDKGSDAITELSNRRLRGYFSWLRGDALFHYRNRAGARRSLARALLISGEFRDRWLEANARLGLARCDDDATLASQAVRIFDDLQADELVRKAKDERINLSKASDERWREFCPSFVLFIGPPGTGKSTAAHMAHRMIAGWGFDSTVVGGDDSSWTAAPTPESSGLATLERQLNKLQQNHSGECDARGIRFGRARRQIYVASIKLIDPGQLAKKEFCSGRLGNVLCLQLEASAGELRKRNAQRRRGQLEDLLLEKLLEPLASHGRHYDRLDGEPGCHAIESAEGSPEDLRQRLRRQLALSFMPASALWQTKGIFRVGRSIPHPSTVSGEY